VRLVPAEQPPVPSDRLWPHYVVEKFLALGAKHLSNEFSFAGRRPLIHAIDRLVEFLFDKTQVVIHRGIRQSQGHRGCEKGRQTGQSKQAHGNFTASSTITLRLTDIESWPFPFDKPAMAD
jgi:hypothetical protein